MEVETEGPVVVGGPWSWPAAGRGRAACLGPLGTQPRAPAPPSNARNPGTQTPRIGRATAGPRVGTGL
eukprot:6926961-Lingulodinium_polyedra.AAC.1